MSGLHLGPGREGDSPLRLSPCWSRPREGGGRGGPPVGVASGGWCGSSPRPGSLPRGPGTWASRLPAAPPSAPGPSAHPPMARKMLSLLPPLLLAAAGLAGLLLLCVPTRDVREPPALKVHARAPRPPAGRGARELGACAGPGGARVAAQDPTRAPLPAWVHGTVAALPGRRGAGGRCFGKYPLAQLSAEPALGAAEGLALCCPDAPQAPDPGWTRVAHSGALGQGSA